MSKVDRLNKLWERRQGWHYTAGFIKHAKKRGYTEKHLKDFEREYGIWLDWGNPDFRENAWGVDPLRWKQIRKRKWG